MTSTQIPELLAQEQELRTRYIRSWPAIRGILTRLEGLTYFQPHDADRVDTAAPSLAANHLTRLAAALNDQTLSGHRVEFRFGDLHLFDELAPDIENTEGWGDPMNISPWGTHLRACRDETLARLAKHQNFATLVAPPLWPVPGHTSVVHQLTPAAWFPPAHLRGPKRWGMIQHIEYNAWHNIEWAVAYDGDLSGSPFDCLLDLHVSGLYPLGLRGSTFVVFGAAI